MVSLIVSDLNTINNLNLNLLIFVGILKAFSFEFLKFRFLQILALVLLNLDNIIYSFFKRLEFRESDVSPGNTEVKQGIFVKLISQEKGYFKGTCKSQNKSHFSNP